MKKDDAFTLIEMMIVLLIISILLLVAVPNMITNSDVAHSKSCEATIDLLQAQVGSYIVENGEKPTSLEDLKEADYVDEIECSNGTSLTLNDGIVMAGSE